MKTIVTFTVAAGKRLIGRAVPLLPEIRHAREHGKILMIGGTTVSAVAEELVGVPMRISGRISAEGLKLAKESSSTPHNLLIEGSGWRNVDGEVEEITPKLGEDDVVIVGANVIDAQGGAAVMAGVPLGGERGKAMTGMMVEGCTIVVPAGLEKLIPGTIADAVRAAGRKGVDRAMGMSVGLMPIFGTVITEIDAIRLLAPVECQVIGKGGIDGAEGGLTLMVSGKEADAEKIFLLALELQEATTSGSPESLIECVGASPRCRQHLSCIYRSPKLRQPKYQGNGTLATKL